MNKESLPEIIRLRVKKWSYEKIGERLGFSKQRVHQIYKSYTKLPSSMLSTKRTQLGGKCSVCGIKKNLEIHHEQGRKNNIENLTLYCREHHLKEESRLHRLGKPIDRRVMPIVHGTISLYTNHRCRCNPCKKAVENYNRSYYRARKTVAY